MKDIFNKFYLKIKNLSKRQKFTIIAITILIINIIIINKFFSYGYYYDNNAISIMSAKVGNMYTDYDYVLEVYLEDSEKSIEGKTYHLTNKVPEQGYSFNHYYCINGSAFNFDNANKMTKAQITKKDVCTIYFDLL